MKMAMIGLGKMGANMTTRLLRGGHQVVAYDLAFHYRDSFEANPILEAYERLFLDALHGDAALFTRGDRAELAWRLLDPILAAWQAGMAPLAGYQPGSWGPAEADELLARDGRAWLHGCAH